MNPTYTLHYLRGLCAMLRDLRNGRVSHERDNLLQSLTMYATMLANGREVPREAIGKSVSEALALIRRERR